MNKIFIDGSCLNNGRSNAVAGWAYIVVDNKGKESARLYGKIREGLQDSNRAELEALNQAFKYIYHNKGSYIIYSDNEAIVNCVQGSSRRVSNRDIWEEAEEYCLAINDRIKDVKYVESHQTDDNLYANFNNEADSLAKMGANSLLIAPLAI